MAIDDKPERAPSRAPAPRTSQLRDVLDPIGVPSWKPPPGDVRQLPYLAIGRVRVLRDGAEVETGTCWRVGANTAITAAHVVAHGEARASFRIDFPDATDVPVFETFVPAEFGRATGRSDPFDIALMRLPAANRAFLAFSSGLASRVALVGFPFLSRSAVMESFGSVVQPDAELLLHDADSASGHSGAPLLMADTAGATRAIGVHIAGFSGNPHEIRFPRRNVALQFRPALASLIAAQVARWG